MSLKELANTCTYRPHDATSSGYKFQLYSNGRVSATGHSRWQGSINGDRWVLDNAIDVSAIDNDDQDTDATALLTDFVERFYRNFTFDFFELGFRKTRLGDIVS